MASTSSVLSHTLRSITLTKIKELEKQRDAYDRRKTAVLKLADEQSDARNRLEVLVDGLKDFPELVWYQRSVDVQAARQWLAQSQYDPTIRPKKLSTMEQKLRAQLDAGSRKLDLARLYSRLLTQWIEQPDSSDGEESDLVESDSEESFEVLQDSQKQRLQQLREKFAKVVFEPYMTDEVEIDNYLSQLFEGDTGKKAVKQLRNRTAMLTKSMLTESYRLDDQSLKWCVKALLKNDMLNDEKKATLKDFLKDEAVLHEIRDVLNMRIRDLKTWDWDLGDQGMPVMPRQSLNGKWRVMMDEDVLQALLTHWIGTYLAVKLKDVLCHLRGWNSLWKQGSYLSDTEKERLSYFFEEYEYHRMAEDPSVEDHRRETYTKHFFMAPLPSKLFEEAGGYDDDDDPPETDPTRKSPKDIKQLLLRTLTTEVILRRSFEGEVAVVQSDFQWFAAGMPHSTIFAVLRFMGFQEEWIDFFKKALSPPMDMLDGQGARRRQRGLPMAHIFEKLLGELVLFFMDLAVAQTSGMLLYRFHDDLWLAGKPAKCSAAWQTMETFAKVMGLEFNKNKTGSVYVTVGDRERDPAIEQALPAGPVEMNFLTLDPESGAWVVNQQHVQKHVEQLQKQLDGSKSVLQWIKTWNSCIGRFFSYTFGEPAQCFGGKHLEKVLQTHQEMQHFLFGNNETGTTVIEHLQKMIADHFQHPDVPDLFFSMPESLGGLGLKNPFTGLSLQYVAKDPETRMRDFHQSEREAYQGSKKRFDALSEKARRKRYKAAFLDDDDQEHTTPPSLSWEAAQSFLSFADFTAHRELTSTALAATYRDLLEPAALHAVAPSAEVQIALKSLDPTPDGLDLDDAENLHREALWTLLHFQDELFEGFGGVEVVDRALLPLGVLQATKERKVTWQMVL